MLLNNQWITEEIKEEIKKKHLQTNDNKNTTIQYLWVTANQTQLHSPRARHPGVWNQVGLRKNYCKQS